MPLERYHDYDLSQFDVDHDESPSDPRGRKTEWDVCVWPSRMNVNDKPIVIPVEVWDVLAKLAKATNCRFDEFELTRNAARELAKALDGLEKVIALCKDGRGIRVTKRKRENS